MRAITKYASFATPATTYKRAPLYQHRSIGQYDTNMTSYAQRSTLYYFHLYLWYYVYNVFLHNNVSFFYYKTLHKHILFLSQSIEPCYFCNF